MATITNAFTTQTSVGNREDLIDAIYNVKKMTTPFLSTISSRTKASATLHEWQVDDYNTTNPTTGEPEGDETTRKARTPTARLNNVCQINSENATTTGTQESIDKAGRASEMAYQMAKATKELKVTQERALLGNQIKDANDPRQMGGLPTWITTNESRGAGGLAGGLGATAATDGTQRDLTEVMVDDVLESAWNNSNNDSFTLLVGSKVKRQIATFQGRANTRQMVDATKAVNTVDIYDGPLGSVKVMPTRYGRTRDAYCLDGSMVKVAYLPGRAYHKFDLAKIGDAETKVILSEYTLEVCNEKALGVIADLNDV